MKRTRNASTVLHPLAVTSLLVSIALAVEQNPSGDDLTQTDVFVSGKGGYHTYRIPALIASAKGTLLAFCEGRKSRSADDGDIDLLLRRSFDGGRNWQPAQLVHEEGGTAEITIGNPCPVLNNATGAIHLLFTRNNQRAFHTSSSDDGATWSAPKEITDVARMFEYPWTRLATGPGHGLQLQTPQHQGRIVIPMWLNDGVRKTYRSAVLISDDAGRSWQTGGIVGPQIPDTNECMVVELPDGTLLLNMRAKAAKNRTNALSKDGGRTWSAPEYVKQLICPVCQASLLGPTDNNGRPTTRLLFANPASARREKLTVRLSPDCGRTWPVSEVIHPGPAAYSDLAVLAPGWLGCLYEAGQTSPYEKIILARLRLDRLAPSPPIR